MLVLVAGLWIVGGEAICWMFGPFRDEPAIARTCDFSWYGGAALVFVAMIVEWRGRKPRPPKR